MLSVILLVQALTVAVSGPPTAMAYLPVRVAEAEGYFTREGLTVTLRPMRDEPEAVAALFDGHVDLAVASLETATRRAPQLVAPKLRLVAGLTAAPPAAVVAATRSPNPPRTIASLARRRVGIPAPGIDDTWLTAVLARAKLTKRSVDVISLGVSRELEALESGAIDAAYLEDPLASELLASGRATLLADLRSVKAAADTLRASTVHAAVFARADTLPDATTLAAFTRSLVAAEARIGAAEPDELAARLPSAFRARPDDFAAALKAAKGFYLPDAAVSAAQVRASFDVIRGRMPLPAAVRLPSPRELIDLSRR